MQQAYRVLRIVAESQTIRIVLMLRPNELMLKELYTACTDLKSEKSRGIKAVVLDFKSVTETHEPHNATVSPAIIDQACLAVRAVEAPVLAVVRGTASAEACELIRAADLTLVAHDAVLLVRVMGDDNNDTLTGEQAHRLGYLAQQDDGDVAVASLELRQIALGNAGVARQDLAGHAAPRPRGPDPLAEQA